MPVQRLLELGKETFEKGALVPVPIFSGYPPNILNSRYNADFMPVFAVTLHIDKS